MATDKQLNANRINAQRSSGPKTEEGQEKVRANAIKHGFCAKMIDVIPGEKPEEFAAHVDAWVDDFAPRNAYEAHLIRHAARLSWKLDRADRYEVASLSRKANDAIDACNSDSAEAIAEAAALSSFDPSNEGERLRRYQFALHRQLHREMDSFSKQRLQQTKGLVIGANEPIVTEPAAAPNKPNSEPAAAPNKPNSAAPIQVSFTLEKERSIEPIHSRPIEAQDARQKPHQPTPRQSVSTGRADRAQLKARSLEQFAAGSIPRPPISLGL